jgi:hypothetical protein
VRRSSPTGHLRDHRHRRVDVAGGADGLLDLVQVAERLEDHAVGAAWPQRGDLLAERRRGLLARRRAVGLDAHAERAHGAGDEHRPPARRRVAASRATSAPRRLIALGLRLEPVTAPA